MPWDSRSFVKHNRSLTPKKAKVAAKIANKVLAESQDEGKAIRIANAAVKKTKKREK